MGLLGCMLGVGDVKGGVWEGRSASFVRFSL